VDLLASLPMTFPLMRGGGMFLVAIGASIAMGGFGPPRWLVPSLIAGAALGVVVGGATKIIFAGLGTPSLFHWIVLGSRSSSRATLSVSSWIPQRCR
jgi:hypothetical protein